MPITAKPQILSTQTKFTALDLKQGEEITNEDIEALTTALEFNRYLVILDLRVVFLPPSFIIKIAELLNKNFTLTSLNLRGNLIEDAGATAIASALRINSTLIDLDIGYSNIGSNGAVEIASMLAVNSTLDTLIIDMNQYDNTGVIAIASALEINRSLRKLNLSSARKMRTRGVVALADSLIKNSSLTHLDVSETYAGMDLIWAFAITIRFNSTLSCLYLQNIHISTQEMPAFVKLKTIFASALETNTAITSTLFDRRHFFGDRREEAEVQMELDINLHLITNKDLKLDSISKFIKTVIFILNSRLKHFETTPLDLDRLPVDLLKVILIYALFPLFNKSEASRIVDSVISHLDNRNKLMSFVPTNKCSLEKWLVPSGSNGRLRLLPKDSPVLAQQSRNSGKEEKKIEGKPTAASTCRFQ